MSEHVTPRTTTSASSRLDEAAETGRASSEPARLAVLISGGGRSLLNIHDRITSGSLRACIPLVIASRPCPGALRAGDRGLRVRVVPGRIPRAALEQVLVEHRIEWVVLAGYLSYLEIPDRYRGRVVNIHPSLLPAFGGPGMYGHHVHEAVLNARATESGCTVHLVNDTFDDGPVVLQKRCAVLSSDTPDSLGARVFELECEAYPEALRQLIGGS